MTWSCTIPGQPVAKARARVTRRGTYTPRSTQRWEGNAALLMRSAWRREPLTGAVSLRVVCVLKRPGRLDYHDSPTGRVPHTARPDADNLAKAVKDALQAARVVRDDSQVVRLEVLKLYAAKGEEAHVRVEVEDYRGHE